MCLLSITNIPSKSVKAITCYKIVYHHFNIYSGIWTGFEYGVNNLENKLRELNSKEKKEINNIINL